MNTTIYLVNAHFNDWGCSYQKTAFAFVEKEKADYACLTLNNLRAEAQHNKWWEWDSEWGEQKSEDGVFPHYFVEETTLIGRQS